MSFLLLQSLHPKRSSLPRSVSETPSDAAASVLFVGKCSRRFFLLFDGAGVGGSSLWGFTAMRTAINDDNVRCHGNAEPGDDNFADVHCVDGQIVKWLASPRRRWKLARDAYLIVRDVEPTTMARWAWRVIRAGFEQADRAYNSRLAERLLCSALADDFAIALDQIGFKIVPLDGHADRWPLTEAAPPSLCPTWCVSVRKQERAITDGMAEVLDGHGRGSGRKARAAL